METTKVTLVAKKGTAKEEEREFDVSHAERLLKLQEEKGLSDWELPEKSGYKFKDGTIQLTGSGKNKESGGKDSAR